MTCDSEMLSVEQPKLGQIIRLIIHFEAQKQAIGKVMVIL